MSRQREFLADASAVQFTRNPEGIAGALRRIGGVAHGSKLQTAHAVEHSHLFFGSAISSFLGGIFATHPPLPERIGRVLPSWDGTFLAPLPIGDGADATRDSGDQPTDYGQRLKDILIPGTAGFAGPQGVTSPDPPEAVPSETDTLPAAIAQIGEPTPAHLKHAQNLIGRIPAVLKTAAHTSTGAQSVVCALLLDRKDAEVRSKQLDYLREQANGPVAVLSERLAEPALALPIEQRLPLLDLALPSLARLHPEVQDQLQAHVDHLIEVDHRLDLFEWALRQVLWRHLTVGAAGGRTGRRKLRRLAEVRGALERVMSVLAQVGNAGDAEAAFSKGSARLPDKLNVELIPLDGVSMARLTDAADELACVYPQDMKTVITACAAVINADGRVTARETELMRAIAETLGVPVPPLLAGQSLL